MVNDYTKPGRILLASCLGAIAGGLLIALATRAIPKVMSRMMAGMMKDMMAQMQAEGGSFAEF